MLSLSLGHYTSAEEMRQAQNSVSDQRKSTYQETSKEGIACEDSQHNHYCNYNKDHHEGIGHNVRLPALGGVSFSIRRTGGYYTT